MIHYLSPINTGLLEASSNGDGYSINLRWAKGYSDNTSMEVAYNLYLSTVDGYSVFSNGPSFICIDNVDNADILELVPGQVYYCGVRAVEYNPELFDFESIPRPFNNLIVPPTSYLSQDMTAFDGYIHLIDSEDFPSIGIVKVGAELINYDENSNNTLGVGSTMLQRGFYGTKVLPHRALDGYDGISKFDPTVYFCLGIEENNKVSYAIQNRFEFDNFSFTNADGYKQVIKDTLSTDLSYSDDENVAFPEYTYSGYHRISPVDLLSGECVGSYIGGESICIGPDGSITQVRGLNLQNINDQRQEELLSLTGEPTVLFRRQTTGVVCSCYLPSSEYQDDRCPYCFGTKFVMGYEQYFNPRRSDGRIMVRYGVFEDDLKMSEPGLELEQNIDCWTLTVPTIKDRDFIIRFNLDGTEDSRYEVLSVSRNRTILGQQGGQKFKISRVRKTDVIYKVNAFRNTQYVPQTIATSIVSSNGIMAHSHNITVNEGNAAGFSQLTSSAAGHQHQVSWDPNTGTLKVLPTLGHTHQISL